jgi:hypothetical protein
MLPLTAFFGLQPLGSAFTTLFTVHNLFCKGQLDEAHRPRGCLLPVLQ